MVEHDLAKVGVASSNLVSRSIFILLLTLPLCSFASTLSIQKTYCIKNDAVHGSSFGYEGKPDFLIMTVPKDRMQYTVPSSVIINAFVDKNVTIVDGSDGVVIFKRHCALMGKSDEIETAFLEKFQETFPLVRIDGAPHISVKSSLPSDFEHYTLESITIPLTMMQKRSGSFVGSFSVLDKKKKITFYYEMDAKVMAFKAKRNLQSGKILQNDDIEALWVDIDVLPSKPILGEMPRNLIVKNYIKEGQILGTYFFDTKKDISKKETIKALYSEGSLAIELYVTLQEDANIGDVVKVKTEQGKVLNAKILSTKEAKILE